MLFVEVDVYFFPENLVIPTKLITFASLFGQNA